MVFIERPEYEAKNPDELPAIAPVTPFALELRSRVREYFEREAKSRGVPFIQALKATPARIIQIVLLAAVFLATVPAFLRGEWWTLIATPIR